MVGSPSVSSKIDNKKKRGFGMEKILIVGAGGFGREVHNWIIDSKENYPNWELVGFIDDDLSALDGYSYDVNIVSTISDYQPKPNEYLVLAIGNPKTRSSLAALLENRGAGFETLIHRTAVVGENVKLGRGCVLCPNSVITADSVIGAFAIINCNSTVGHDTRIGDFTTISGHADITGYARVGKGVIIGSHACILPGVSVADGAIVGAGSVVIKNVKEGTTVFGNPARSIL